MWFHPGDFLKKGTKDTSGIGTGSCAALASALAANSAISWVKNRNEWIYTLDPLNSQIPLKMTIFQSKCLFQTTIFSIYIKFRGWISGEHITLVNYTLLDKDGTPKRGEKSFLSGSFLDCSILIWQGLMQCFITILSSAQHAIRTQMATQKQL